MQQAVETSRAQARNAHRELLTVLVERLIATTGAKAARLVGFERDGVELGRAEVGVLTEDGSITALLALCGPPLAAVTLVQPEPRTLAVALPRAAVALGNARFAIESEAQAELVAIVGHEVRNPLAGILGFSDLLPDEALELSARHIELMRRIQADAQRLAARLDTGLALVRAQRPYVVTTQLEPVCADLARLFSPWAQANGAGFVLQPVPMTMLADGERMTLLLANLIADALEGGRSFTLRAALECSQDTEPPRWGSLPWRASLELGELAPGTDLLTATGGLGIASEIIGFFGGRAQVNGARLRLALPALPPTTS